MVMTVWCFICSVWSLRFSIGLLLCSLLAMLKQELLMVQRYVLWLLMLVIHTLVALEAKLGDVNHGNCPLLHHFNLLHIIFLYWFSCFNHNIWKTVFCYSVSSVHKKKNTNAPSDGKSLFYRHSCWFVKTCPAFFRNLWQITARRRSATNNLTLSYIMFSKKNIP